MGGKPTTNIFSQVLTAAQAALQVVCVMTLYAQQLIDASAASFFSLLGLGAATVRGHWFLRAAVVALVLAVSFLIPAPLVAIEFAIQIAVVWGVIAWVGRPHGWRPRFSVTTVLLATALAATASATVAQATDLPLQTWVFAFGVGIATAALGLGCLWLQCGRPKWYWRLLATVGLIFVVAVGGMTNNALRNYLATGRASATFADLWLKRFNEAKEWLLWVGPTAMLGLAAISLAIWFAVRTEWFSDQGTTEQRSTRRKVWAMRAALVVCFLVLSWPAGSVLVTLVSPAPLWEVVLPADNGFDDFLAAAEMIPRLLPQREYEEAFLEWAKQDERNRKDEAIVAQLRPVYHRVQIGLDKACAVPAAAGLHLWDFQDEAFGHLCTALFLRCQAKLRDRDLASYLAATWDYARCDRRLLDGGVLDDHTLDHGERLFRLAVWLVLNDASREQCLRMQSQLLELDASRESFAMLRWRQSIANQRSDWESAMWSIATDWDNAWGRPDSSQYWWDWEQWHRNVAETRILIAQLGVQAFLFDHGVLPDRLEQLVPQYLPAIPLDPFGGEPFRYRRHGSEYIVYSNSWNLKDDGGSEALDPVYSRELDLVRTGPKRGSFLGRFVHTWISQTSDQLRAWYELLKEKVEGAKQQAIRRSVRSR